MKVCRNCGEKYSDDNNFCEACGCPLEEAVMENNEFQNPEPKKKTGWWLLIGILILALGGGGIFAVYKVQDKKIQEVKKESEKKEKKAKKEKKEKDAEVKKQLKEKEDELEKQLKESAAELEKQLQEKEAELQRAKEELESKQSRESVAYYYSDTPEDAFTNYVYVLVNAINTGDYSEAHTVMKVGSSLYNEQQKLVNRLHGKGISEEVVKCGIKSSENISSTQVRIVSDEIIKVIYKDGTRKNLSQCYGYICELTGEGWLLTKIEEL